MFAAAPGGGAWAPGSSQGTLTPRVAANRIDPLWNLPKPASSPLN
jgi:hypothetical protein